MSIVIIGTWAWSDFLIDATIGWGKKKNRNEYEDGSGIRKNRIADVRKPAISYMP